MSANETRIWYQNRPETQLGKHAYVSDKVVCVWVCVCVKFVCVKLVYVRDGMWQTYVKGRQLYVWQSCVCECVLSLCVWS